VAVWPDGQVRIDFAAEATPEQRIAGQQIADTWDFAPPAQAERENLENREKAKILVDLLGTDLGKALRAEAAVLVDEINLLRQWLVSFKAATAAATSLADFKARVAALANLPDRTLTQAKNAIVAKIDSGIVD
jgi:hypothetical protein